MASIRPDTTQDTAAAALRDPETGKPSLQRLLEMTSTYEFFKLAVNKRIKEHEMRKTRGSVASMGSVASAEPASTPAAPSGPGDEASDAYELPLSLFSEEERLMIRTRLEEILSEARTDLLDEEVKRILEEDEGEDGARGFDPYGAHDEEGLHELEGDDYAQDDYDIEEVRGTRPGGFLYDYRPTHHIEVELNDGSSRAGDPNEPSCEFTFEYDRNGKLVPTSSNIEEKLRLMSLQSQMAEEAPQTKKKKKGSKRKKKAHEHPEKRGVLPFDDSMCLFCQYEAFFGVEPVNMMKWYDQKIMKEERRRQKFKEKLEHAKLNALKRQRHVRSDESLADDLEGSGGTVVD